MNISKIFDADGIYDLLIASNIDNRIVSLLNNNHFIKPLTINLIQRIGFESYLWASEWTNKVYEFLKPLSRTALLTNGEVNGSVYGFTPEYTANIPNTLSLPLFPNEVTLKVYPQSTVTITWLQSSHYGVSSTYCNKVSNLISCYEKRVKVVTARDKEVEVKLNSQYWLWNSVVIQGNGLLVGITNGQKELILYDYLQQTLDSVYGQFDISECKVLTGVTATVSNISITAEGGLQYPPVPSFSNESIEWSNPVFQSVPENYYFTYLETSSNSYGRKPLVIYYENQKSLTIELKPQKLSYFEKWRDRLIEKEPCGFDVNFDDNQNVPEINYPVTGLENLVFKTNKGNQPNNELWVTANNLYHANLNPITYPLLDKNTPKFRIFERARLSGNYLSYLQNLYGQVKVLNTYDDFVEYTRYDDNYLKVDSNSDKKGYYIHFDAIYGSQNIPYVTAFNSTYSGENIFNFATFSLAGSGYGDYLRARYNFVVVPFIGEDYNLFSSDDVGLIKLSIDSRVAGSIEYRTAIKQALRITTENQDIENPVIAFAVVNNEATLVSSKVYDSNDHSPNYTLEHSLGLGITLARTLRTQQLPNNGFGYFFVDSEQKILKISENNIENFINAFTRLYDKVVVSNNSDSVSIVAESNNFEITFTRPHFDPDTDNGDIMPDSQRLIEIHSALQADKFAYDEDNPTSLRVANIGYYVERLARILGISVNSDGSLRQVRQRMTFDPNQKPLPAGWTRGQWSINNGGDSQGQEGGLSTEERDGIAYKHRCNRSVESAFNEQEFELGSPLMTLCENYFQFFETFLEDLDAGLNWQEMGAMAIPSPFPDSEGNNTYCTFEGMGTLLAEIAYSQGVMSKDTSQTYIASIVIQSMVKALLGSVGTPLETGYYETQVETEDGNFSTKIPVPVLPSDSPTLLQLLFNVIANQARQAGSQAKLKTN